MADNLLRGFTNPEMNVNYNHFDRSYHNGLTAKAGQVLPVVVIDTDPGDKFQCSIAAQIRSFPMTTPAMLRCKINFEWYFVPYSQLNHNWNSVFATVNEFGSSTDQDVFTQADVDLPYLPLTDIMNFAFQATTVQNVFGQDIRGDVGKLTDLLDYGGCFYLDKSNVNPLFHKPQFMSNSVSLDVVPWRYQAYQKIWNCYMRDKYYDPIDRDAAAGYNTDDILMGSGNTPNIQAQRDAAAGASTHAKTLQNMMCLRYHRYKSDMFNSALPSRQDGVVSSISLSGQILNVASGVTSGDKAGVRLSGGLNVLGLYDSSNNYITGSGAIGAWQFPNAFDVLTLRQAEALQRWKEITLRAGKNINKQYKGHTGFTPKFAIDNYPEFIGSFDSVIAVDEVQSTSDTLTNNSGSIEGAQLGQLAGKGISVTGRNGIKYFARDHGVLMCLAYILPDVPYNASGVSAFNTKMKRSSYYMKEFENCGLVPVPRRELDISNVTTQQQMNSVLGYLPYGYESKTNYDRVHGELQYGRTLESWTPTRRDLLMSANAIPAVGGLNKSVRYCKPSILDPIFAVNADETDATDQFIINLYGDVKNLSDKSVLGLPNF